MCLKRRETLYQVGIAVKVMFTVGSINVSFCFTYQQFIFCKKIKKSISSDDDVMLFKKRREHDEEFSSATAWLKFSYKIYLLQDQMFMR